MRRPDASADFDRRFTPLRSRLLGYLQRRTVDPAEAEDVAQETLLAAYRQRESFRTGAAPLPYLIGIARRRLRDRQRAHHPSAPLMETDRAVADGAPALIDALILRRALDRLPEAQRRVLELTAIDGRTYREAAALLGEPVGTLKWRVHEAVQALRTYLTEEETS